MNLMEFLFAVTTVFGSTAVVTLWQYLIYKIDNEEEKKEQSEDIRIVK
jgi:phage shock protein PspC (stress-responsive transcriptional regulator)